MMIPSACGQLLPVLTVWSVAKLCLTVTSWPGGCQAPLSLGFSRQECWSGLPFPPPGDLRDPGTERRALHSEAKNCTAGGFFTTETPGKPWKQRSKYKKTDRVIWETYKCVCFM